VAAVDPASGWGLPCPLRTVTGLWCPACGLTRATHHLLRGELTTALRYNALVGVGLLAIALSWLNWAACAAGRPVAWPGSARLRRASVAVVIGIAVVFGVVRNLPGVDGLRG
jgi:hypothetical protein